MSKRKRENSEKSGNIFDEIVEKIGRNTKKNLWTNVPSSIPVCEILKVILPSIMYPFIVVGLESDEFIQLNLEIGHLSNRTKKYINHQNVYIFSSSIEKA